MRLPRTLPASFVVCACVLLLAACGAASPSISSGSAVPAPADGVAYCTDKGGAPTRRQAAWNTNQDPAAWLLLAGSQTFCEVEMTEGDNTTRISVDLGTLSSEAPTLAAIALPRQVVIAVNSATLSRLSIGMSAVSGKLASRSFHSPSSLMSNSGAQSERPSAMPPGSLS